MARTKKREVTGAKRGENGAVLVLMARAKQKGKLFCHGEVFFLLTGPLMGDPFSLNEVVGVDFVDFVRSDWGDTNTVLDH